eukprot:scaffold5112_cov87-Phaeocystis_antarctica.AAC.1
MGQLTVASWTVRVHNTIRSRVGSVAGRIVLPNVADTFSTHYINTACRRPVLSAQLCLGSSTMVHTTLPRHMGPQGSSCRFPRRTSQPTPPEGALRAHDPSDSVEAQRLFRTLEQHSFHVFK